VAAAPLLLLLATCQVDKLTNNPPPVATLAVTPSGLRDSAAVGSTAQRGDTLAIANVGPGTMSWTARTARAEPWVTMSRSSGTAPANLGLAYDARGLAPGVYRDTVIVSAENAKDSPARVPVEFMVYPCRATAITPDAQLNDSLTTGSCAAPHRSGAFARLYAFTAQAGDSVSVVMSSAVLDGYVVLDSSVTATVAPIAQSGSCSAEPGACLRYQRLATTRTYVVEATSASAGRTGPYTLTVTRPRPPAGTSGLAQFRSDGTTAIPVGGGTDESTVLLRGVVSDPDAADTLRLQVEVRALGTTFSDVSTAQSGRVANGAVAFVSIVGLANNTGYHWQARVVDQTGRASAWVPFGGGNLESVADFSTSIPAAPASPTGLGQFQSDVNTAIPVGGTGTGRSVVFQATVADPNPGDQLRLEVEVRPVGTDFTGDVSGSGATVGTGAVATATVGGLSDNTAYHWRAHTIDQTGRTSPWQSFGANAETATDFRVAVAVSHLGFTPQPADGVAGVAMPAVRVAAQDAQGTTVTSFSGTVTVALAGNPGADTLSGTKTVAAVNGVATFSTLSIDHAAAGYTLRATATGLTVTSAPFAVVAGSATQIAVNAGNNQTLPAGTAVPIPPSVIVRDAKGNPVPGSAVTFAVAPGNGSITGASQTTNASGIATVGSWTLATAAGTNALTATSTGLTGSPVAFTATGTAGDAGSIAVNAGNGQSATVGTAVATDPSVVVRDQFANPVAGVSVTFAVGSGGGTVIPTTAVTTNASGIATVIGLAFGGMALAPETVDFSAATIVIRTR